MEQAHDPDQQLAERYFLGQLTDAEAEAFEAHYFDCARCAAYVREEQMLLDGLREVARRKKVAPAQVVDFRERTKARFQWMPAAAAAMLVTAIGLTVIPLRRATVEAPHVYSPDPRKVEFSLNRTKVTPELTFKAGEPIMLEVYAPQDASEGDEAVIRNAETQELIPPATTLTQDHLEDAFFLLPRALPAGRYEVVIERADGNRRARIATKPFEVRR